MRSFCDLHNHLLPEIDDGCVSIDETIRYLRDFHDEGVATVVFTPHLLVPDLTGSALDRELGRQRDRFDEVVDAVEGLEGVPELHLGQEILAPTAEDIERVVARDDVGLAGGDALLVEFGFRSGFEAEAVVERVRAEGRTIVVAHPERYDYGAGDPVVRVARWHERGALLQMNGGSFAGLYRRPWTEDFARCLLAEGLVDMVCSDHHGDYRAHGPGMIAETIERLGEPGLAERLMARGPRRIVPEVQEAVAA